MGRQAAGVRLVRLDESQTLLAVKAFEAAEDNIDSSKPASGMSAQTSLVQPRPVQHKIRVKTDKSTRNRLKQIESEVENKLG